MRRITTGAPNTAVTVLMANSDGENAVRAIKSQAMQNTPPSRKEPGMITMGRAVPNSSLVMCGTATPTKEMGPDSAVTLAESRLESPISATRNALIFTPMLRA